MSSRRLKTYRKAPKQKAKKKQKGPSKDCIMCNKAHWRDSAYCSDRCRSRSNRNDTYFDGRMLEAVGWANKQCQACLVEVKRPRKFHVHHVYGHPDHSRLVVLCAGCHELVSKMAWRKMDLQAFERLVAFAFMQRDKKPLEVDIEVMNG